MNNKFLCNSIEIDLSSTLDGGQSFRWHKFENGFNGVINNKPYFIFQENKKIFVEAEEINSNDVNLVFNYLSLDVDLRKISKKFKNNLYLNNLFKKYYGLRILNQDPWETIVSFITSSVSNILKIKKNINDLCVLNGEKIGKNKYDYTFPDPIKIIDFGENNLRKIGFGFRSPYIIDACKKVIDGDILINNIYDLNYDDALHQLTKINGVGRKVADCILTYGYHRKDVFAVDRWVRRGLINKLGYSEKLQNDKLSIKARKKYGNESSYIQQYIFFGEKS